MVNSSFTLSTGSPHVKIFFNAKMLLLNQCLELFINNTFNLGQKPWNKKELLYKQLHDRPGSAQPDNTTTIL